MACPIVSAQMLVVISRQRILIGNVSSSKKTREDLAITKTKARPQYRQHELFFFTHLVTVSEDAMLPFFLKYLSLLGFKPLQPWPYNERYSVQL